MIAWRTSIVTLVFSLVALPCMGATASHLDLAATLDDQHQLTGTATWHFTNPTPAPMHAVHFLLWANFDEAPNPRLSAAANATGFYNAWEPSGTRILAARDAAGGPLAFHYQAAPAVTQTFNLQNVFAVVDLPTPLPPGQTITIRLDFRTLVPHRRGDQGHFNGDTTWRFGWFPQPRHLDGSGWSDAIVLTSFTHQTTLVVPAGKRGIVGAEQAVQTGREVRAQATMPVRSVPIVVSSRLREETRAIAGIDVSVFSYRDLAIWDTSTGEAREKLEQLERILPFLQTTVGPYRLRRLQIVESPTTGLAMAADGLVLLADSFFVYNRIWLAWNFWGPIGETTLAHEVAHQWFGIGLGVDFDADNWLSEGFAQLLSLWYGETRFGSGGNDVVKSSWFLNWAMANFSGTPLPSNQLEHLILPSYQDHVRFGLEEPLVVPQRRLRHVEESVYRLYQKGYLGARSLLSLLGQACTVQTLQVLYRNKAGAVVTVEDLRQAARTACQGDLAPLVDGFVLGDKRMDLGIVDVATVAGPQGFQVSVKVHRDGELALPARVRVRTALEEQSAIFAPNAADATLEFRTLAPPDNVEIDPERWVPDTDRRNNVWPQVARMTGVVPAVATDAYTLGVNYLPLHLKYLAGLTVGGRAATRHSWRLGGGLVNLSSRDNGKGQGSTTLTDWGGYGEALISTGRGRQFSFTADATHVQTRFPDPYTTGSVGLQHRWSIYSPTDLGNTGVLELPRTLLGLGMGYSGVLLDNQGPYTFKPNSDGSGFVQKIAHSSVFVDGLLGRSEIQRYGFYVLSALRFGVSWLPPPLQDSPNAYLLTGRNRIGSQPWPQQWFGRGVLDGDYLTVIPYLGHLTLSASGGMVTPNAIADQRPYLRSLPYMSFRLDMLPYDAVVDGGARLSLPIFRDARIKNELTLGLFVLNDLSLDLHYGAALGWTWTLPEARVLARSPSLGEAGAALRVGIATFDTTPISLSFGAGLPVWPSPTQVDAIRFFFLASLGSF
jgi:hypothetical protein